MHGAETLQRDGETVFGFFLFTLNLNALRFHLCALGLGHLLALRGLGRLFRNLSQQNGTSLGAFGKGNLLDLELRVQRVQLDGSLFDLFDATVEAVTLRQHELVFLVQEYQVVLQEIEVVLWCDKVGTAQFFQELNAVAAH